MRETLYSYHREYGYSPHSLIAISENVSAWEAKRAHGAVAYLEVGRTWLASEPLAADRDLGTVAQEFLTYAARSGRFAVFLPVTERFARAGVGIGLDCVPLGKSPYFNLPTWKCEGRRVYTVRKELKKAERAGVTFSSVPGAELPRGEAEHLQQAWIATRRTAGLSWIFACGTFNFPAYQKHFLARDKEGTLVGLLSAAPLPARQAYYFKDLHRHPRAPKGTADLLIVGAMSQLREEGFQLATPGTLLLLDIQHPRALSPGNYSLLLSFLELVERRGERLYGFSGLRTFKARFAPTWWEYEYAVAPRTPLAIVRVGIATARAAMPQGVIQTLRKAAITPFQT